MNTCDIARQYATTTQVSALCKVLDDKSLSHILLKGLVGSSAPMLFAGLRSRYKGKEGLVHKVPRLFLVVMDDGDEAGYFYNDLKQLVGDEAIYFFPSSYRRAVKYGQRDAANEILRTEVLSMLDRLSNEENDNADTFVITHPEALAETVVARKTLAENLITITVGQTLDIVAVEQLLRKAGFSEEEYVYEPGQFARRGSILDVYSFSCELPYRIDFFGDEVDTIRTFEVDSQLSDERRQTVDILPRLTTDEGEHVCVLEFMPEDTVVVVKDPDILQDTVARIYEDGFSTQAFQERIAGLDEVSQAEEMKAMQREIALVLPTEFKSQMERFRRIELSSQSSTQPQATLNFDISPHPLFHKNFELLRQTFSHYREQGYEIFLLSENKKQHQRLYDILNEADSDYERSPGNSQESLLHFTAVDGVVHEGYIDNQLKVCLLTDHQIFDRYHKYQLKSDRARTGKMALTMKELYEIEPGDYLVHVDFGIGKFGGLVRVPIDSPSPNAGSHEAYQEKIRLIYQRGDIVDVSIHSLYKISKYRGGDTQNPPRLSTLGTGAWERMKERTKHRIKDIARNLIRLYAQRRQVKGFAFSHDSYLQHELEASFIYEDTPDQLRTTQDVKADMESSNPMDRLVCGDVGFGKTEIAVRAAFKAACDSKQVALLVPTTVLAFQHFQTFKERLKGMPVRVEYLSRARTTKQTRQIIADLAEGKIDILIGTHKLLGKNIKWKDLGLLIIDEEQKFGVATKEKLRHMKTNVDTLTMSATPIPRTLQFSLMGARDMSILRTPPPNRYPIETTLTTFNSEVIADAIGFEMSRNGQVFFVNSRIANLYEIAKTISRHVPDCRIAIAHGQMPPEEMEQVILAFINYDYDVLLSTTIVENGVDIPNANTIIINDAHRFGLSDLHQMRGRVGRSNRKAFCYLLAPPKTAINAEARRRLEALETFSELGSGFNLAMQDLDIRGAGNLLGAEQSGFIEDIGYETYLKILREAMTELANEKEDDNENANKGIKVNVPPSLQGRDGERPSFVADCTVESDLEMYFPDSYIPGSSERMLLYRELDNIETAEALEAYRTRLVDRFGAIPREGEELMQVVALRRIARRLGCEKIILRQQRMVIQLVSTPDSPYYQSTAFDQLLRYIAANPRRCNLKETHGRRLIIVQQVPTVGAAVGVLRAIEATAS